MDKIMDKIMEDAQNTLGIQNEKVVKNKIDALLYDKQYIEHHLELVNNEINKFKSLSIEEAFKAVRLENIKAPCWNVCSTGVGITKGY